MYNVKLNHKYNFDFWLIFYIGLIFFQLDYTQAGVQNINGKILFEI